MGDRTTLRPPRHAVCGRQRVCRAGRRQDFQVYGAHLRYARNQGRGGRHDPTAERRAE